MLHCKASIRLKQIRELLSLRKPETRIRSAVPNITDSEAQRSGRCFPLELMKVETRNQTSTKTDSENGMSKETQDLVWRKLPCAAPCLQFQTTSGECDSCNLEPNNCGNGTEIASNRFEEQALSVLALHLLQISLAYVNTLMIQNVLVRPDWATRLGDTDRHALSPLIYSHINPSGVIELDMTQGIAMSG